jgi:hypothetical protein
VKEVRLSALFNWYNVEKPLCSLKEVLLLLVVSYLDELKISQLFFNIYHTHDLVGGLIW